MSEAKRIVELLQGDLSPDKVINMSPNELAVKLLAERVIESSKDVNMLIIEGIQKALNDDDEFPIHYYSKDEPMHESGIVSERAEQQENLTDDFINDNFN
jgi:hypothetical protein